MTLSTFWTGGRRNSAISLRVCRDAAAGTYHVRFESPPVHHHFQSFRRAWPFRRRLWAADRNLYRHRPSSLVAARAMAGREDGAECFASL